MEFSFSFQPIIVVGIAILNNLGRIASDYCQWRDVFGDYRASSYNGTFANCNIPDHCHSITEPDAITNSNGFQDY